MQNNNLRHVLGNIKLTKKEKTIMLDKILNKKKKKVSYGKYLAIAATLLLIMSSVIFNQMSGGTGEIPNIADGVNVRIPSSIERGITPKIEFMLLDGGMGYGGILLYNIEELTGKNPWTEDMNLTKLPVFSNDFYNQDWDSFIPAQDKETLGKNIAKILGVKILETNEQSTVFTCSKGITIYIDHNLSAFIQFENAIPLPRTTEVDEYSKSLSYVEYFYGMYQNLFKYEQPQFEVTFDYGFDGEKFYRHYVYDNNGTHTEKILNYNMNKATFVLSVEGEGLTGIRIPPLYQYEKIDEYPIISKEMAIQNMLEGKFLTTVPYEEDITLEKIAKVELAYYFNLMTEYIQPVYIAYVELENDRQENGLVVYGIYYVPAIESQYVNIILDEVPFN